MEGQSLVVPFKKYVGKTESEPYLFGMFYGDRCVSYCAKRCSVLIMSLRLYPLIIAAESLEVEQIKTQHNQRVQLAVIILYFTQYLVNIELHAKG